MLAWGRLKMREKPMADKENCGDENARKDNDGWNMHCTIKWHCRTNQVAYFLVGYNRIHRSLKMAIKRKGRYAPVLTAPFPGLPGSAGTRKVKPIWILLKQETVSGSGISWAICKSASHSRQITMPVPNHSFFTGRMPFLSPKQQRQSTEGKEKVGNRLIIPSN